MSDDLELSVTRLIDAPVALVWKIATERLAEWWCPRPWMTDIIEQDWRPGGRSAMIMRGPNGEEHPMEGVFLEVTPERRFVFTDALKAGWSPQTAFMVGLFEFADEGGKTRYTASARHWTAEAKAQHEEMGFVGGWTAVAGQLAEIAEAEARVEA